MPPPRTATARTLAKTHVAQGRRVIDNLGTHVCPPHPAARRLSRQAQLRRHARAAGDEAAKKSQGPLAYVIQKHAATRLHYDLRLEHGGVMWSWAVPKGPSYDPTDKRVAIKTEDHPISYNRFEGTIPKGQYGAGTVLVWDRGSWEPAGDPAQGLAEGKLLFTLHGQKLHGQWELVRIKPKDNERQDPWILFKKRDGYARPREDYDVVRALPDSVGPEPAPSQPQRRAPAKARTGRSKAARKAAGLPLPEAAVPAALPASLSPQLATQASGLPANGRWIFEIKFDGYRMLARFDGAGQAAPVHAQRARLVVEDAGADR